MTTLGIEFTELYKRLIGVALSKGIPIREDSLVPRNSPYQFLSQPPQIRIHRNTQPADAWVDEKSSEARILQLIERSGYSLAELIAVAHELGHSFSQDSGIDSLYDRARAGNPITVEEKERLCSEEQLAWVKAEEVLKDINFSEWESFRNQKLKALETYKGISTIP